MPDFRAFLFAIAVCGLCRCTSAAEPLNIVAEGEWSEPVSDNGGGALRGRLVVGRKHRGENRSEWPIYVELQDASEAVGRTKRLFCEMRRSDSGPENRAGLSCELRDQQGQLIEPVGYPFGGAVPMSQWVALPSDSTIRLRASPFGVSRPDGLALTPHLGALWFISDDDPHEYSLSGMFTIIPSGDEPALDDPGKSDDIWGGTLVLPAVKITAAVLSGAGRLSEFGSGADRFPFPELPDSPIDLIETLKTAGDIHTVLGIQRDYVQESDLPQLISLLDSDEPCASVVLSVSSILPTSTSTVGHEAAYLIDGFRNRYFPTELTSSRFEPDVDDIRHWYRIWSHLKRQTGQDASTADAPR